MSETIAAELSQVQQPINSYKVKWEDIESIAWRVARKKKKNPGLSNEDLVQEFALHFQIKIRAWDHCECIDDAQRYTAVVADRKMTDVVRYNVRRKDTSIESYETENRRAEDYVELDVEKQDKFYEKTSSSAELSSLLNSIEYFCKIMDEDGDGYGRAYAEAYMRCTLHSFEPWEQMKIENVRCRNKQMPTPKQLFNLLSIPESRRSSIEAKFCKFMKEEYGI